MKIPTYLVPLLALVSVVSGQNVTFTTNTTGSLPTTGSGDYVEDQIDFGFQTNFGGNFETAVEAQGGQLIGILRVGVASSATNSGDASIIITTVSGNPFQLDSFDLRGFGAVDLDIVGNLVGGGTFQSTVTAPQNTFGTIVDTAGNDFTSVTLSAEVAQFTGSRTISFDNFAFSPAAVPEPASAAMILGIAALFSVSRRQRS